MAASSRDFPLSHNLQYVGPMVFICIEGSIEVYDSRNIMIVRYK